MQIDQNTVVSAIVVVGWIFSLCFHEFGHGLFAYLGGDKSIKDRGYLSFNPFAYTNVGLSIVLPAVVVLFGGIGLPGAAVMVNDASLRGKGWQSLVSLAGPLFTLLFTGALIGTIQINSNNPAVPREWLAGLSFLVVLELVVLIFNLLPMPGLDGYGIIEPFLPQSIREKLSNLQRVGILVLMVVLWTVPVANNMLWAAAYAGAFVLGLSPDMVMLGQSSFRNGAMPLSVAVILIVIMVHFIKNKTKSEREAAQREAAEIKSAENQSDWHAEK